MTPSQFLGALNVFRNYLPDPNLPHIEALVLILSQPDGYYSQTTLTQELGQGRANGARLVRDLLQAEVILGITNPRDLRERFLWLAPKGQELREQLQRI